jgi:hypothetical protein
VQVDANIGTQVEETSWLRLSMPTLNLVVKTVKKLKEFLSSTDFSSSTGSN